MLETIVCPTIKNKEHWHKPAGLRWVNSISEETELCAVKYSKTPKLTQGRGSTSHNLELHITLSSIGTHRAATNL